MTFGHALVLSLWLSSEMHCQCCKSKLTAEHCSMQLLTYKQESQSNPKKIHIMHLIVKNLFLQRMIAVSGDVL